MSPFITLLLLIIGHDVYAAEILLRKSSASSLSQNAQQNFLMKENQRLAKEIRRLQEINKRPKLPQQHDLIDNNISPSYDVLLEIGMHKEKLQNRLQKHVEAHVHRHKELASVKWGFNIDFGMAVAAANAVGGAAVSAGNSIASGAQAAGNGVVSGAQAAGNGVKYGAEVAANGVQQAASAAGGAASGAFHGAVDGTFEEVANDAVKQLLEELRKQMKNLIGKCDADCFKRIKDATQARLQAGKAIHIVYMGQTAFTHLTDERDATAENGGGGVAKMLIGLVYNSLNGLFDWAMPDIRRHLCSQYTSQIRPIFRSKTAALQTALLKYSTVNIFDSIQTALVDSMRHSIKSACSILPDVSYVIEINFPPYCVVIVETLLRDIRWVRNIVRSVAEGLDSAIANNKAPPLPTADEAFGLFHAAITGVKSAKTEPDTTKALLTSGTAVSIVDWIDQPIGDILDNAYQQVLKALAQIVNMYFKGVNVKAEANALAEIECDQTNLMCKLDAIANMLFLLFDKQNMQVMMSELIYGRMNVLIYDLGYFNFLFNAFDGPEDMNEPGDGDDKLTDEERKRKAG